MPVEDRISWRRFFLAAAIIAVLAGVFTWLEIVDTRNETLTQAGRQAQGMFWGMLGKEMKTTSKALERCAVEVAKDPQVISLLIEARRSLDGEGWNAGGVKTAEIRTRLRNLMLSKWGLIARIHNVEHLHFYLTPREVAFLRMPYSDRFGDSVEGLLEVVETTAETRRPDSGFEIGRAYAGLRAAAPVVVQNPELGEDLLVGMVEAGDTAKSALKDLQLNYGMDCAVFLTREASDTTLWSDLTGDIPEYPWSDRLTLTTTTSDWISELYRQKKVRELILNQIQNGPIPGAPQSVVAEIGGVSVLVSVSGFRDFKGEQDPSREPVGLYVSWNPIPGAGAISLRVVLTSLSYGAGVFLVVMALLFFFWRLVTRRINRLIRDNTGRLEKANLELLKAQERYRSIFENAVQGMFRSNLDGRFLSVNPAMARMLGHESPDKLLAIRNVGTHVYFRPEDHTRWVDILLKKGELLNHEVLLMHKSGRPVWGLMNVKLIEAEDGQTYIEGIVMDNTAQKMADESLKQSEEKYRRIINTTSEGFIMISPELAVTEVNAALLEALGLQREDFESGRYKELFDTLADELHESSLRTVGRNGQAAFGFTFKRPDGKEIPFLVNWSKIVDDEEAIQGYVSFLTDSTGLRTALIELQKAEERYRGIFENAVQGMFLSTLDGRIIKANPAYAQILGYDSVQELAGLEDMVTHHYFNPEDRASWIKELIQKGVLKDREVLLKNKNGSPVWVLGNMWLAKDEKDEPYIEGIVVDHTARKTAEEALLLAKSEAEDASLAKSKFLAAMGFEIRTPLNAIIGMTDLTLQSELSQGQRDNLTTVKDSAQHLLTILNDILDLSKIEASRELPIKVDFDLHRLLRNIIANFKPQARDRYLELGIAKEAPRYLKGNPVRLRQIMVNLLSNALKYTEDGGVIVSVQLADSDGEPVSKNTDGLHLLFSVSDTGTGIPAEKLSQIFETFSYVDDSGPRKYGGTGLGLAICKRLVERDGGRIWVESQLGQGSHFYFTIEYLPGDEAKARGEERKQAKHRAFSGRSLNILVAEDNPTNLKVAVSFLTRLGYRPYTAGNGRQAITALSRDHFDLVLMDIEMPGMDGLEATRRIRNGEAGEEVQNVPIVALTSHSGPEVREDADEAGMNDFVTKPIDFYDLAALIERVVPESAGAAAPPKEIEMAAGRGELLLDWKAALRRFGGDEALLRDLAATFASEMPGNIEALKKALANGDFQKLATQAFDLNNAAAMVGAQTIVQLAANLERTAEEKNTEESRQLIARIDHDFEMVKEKLIHGE